MIKALLLSGFLLAQADGGLTGPNVARVRSADPGDGGAALPAGWWLSPDQMTRVGTRIADCDQKPSQTSPVGIVALIAVVAGFASGVALTAWIAGQVK